MNIQGKTLEEAIGKWNELPDFMDDQDVDHGKDKREIIGYLYDFHCFYGRRSTRKNTSKEHKVVYRIDQVDRCEMDLAFPRLIYWTTKGG